MNTFLNLIQFTTTTEFTYYYWITAAVTLYGICKVPAMSDTKDPEYHMSNTHVGNFGVALFGFVLWPFAIALIFKLRNK